MLHAYTPYCTLVESFSLCFLLLSLFYVSNPSREKYIPLYPLGTENVTNGRVLMFFFFFGVDTGPSWLITIVSVSYANENGISDSN